jgi:hypothetical protein
MDARSSQQGEKEIISLTLSKFTATDRVNNVNFSSFFGPRVMGSFRHMLIASAGSGYVATADFGRGRPVSDGRSIRFVSA